MRARSQLLVSAFLATLLSACGGPEHAATSLREAARGDVVWSRSVSDAYGVQLALDPLGNVLVAGSVPFTSIVTTKYDPLGTPLWQQVFTPPDGRAQASWIAADPAGNAYVAGWLVTGWTDPAGFVLLKYDPSGALLWQDLFPVAAGQAVRVETDAAGNAYVTGRGWLPGSATYVDYLTMKYAPDGTRRWLRSHGLGISSDIPASLAVSPGGRVAVTGSPTGGSPMVTVVYDTDGAVLWSSAAPAGRARDVVFGPEGEVYVAGGTGSLVVEKRDAAGNFVWNAAVPGLSAERLVLDAGGDVFVTGTAPQTHGLPYADWITARIDPVGNVLWTRRRDAHDENHEVPRAIASTGDGGVVVAGQGGPGPSSGTLSYTQMAVVEYDAAGAPAWTVSTFDASTAVAVRSEGRSAFALGQRAALALRIDRGDAAATDPQQPPPPPAEPAPPPPTTEPAPAPEVTPTVRVSDVSLSVLRRTVWKVRVEARVALRDQGGAPVAGATVTATWALPGGSASIASGTSDAAGVARFLAGGRVGTFTLTVNDVAAGGLGFDRDGSELAGSITVQ